MRRLRKARCFSGSSLFTGCFTHAVAIKLLNIKRNINKNRVLLEFAWMGEITTGLARASCSAKEHIRAIDGRVLVEEASNLHAGPF